MQKVKNAPYRNSDSIEVKDEKRFISAIDNFKKYSEKNRRDSESSHTNFTIEDEKENDFKNFENYSEENTKKSSNSVERMHQPSTNLSVFS